MAEDESLGWKGKQVRHSDGRVGKIVSSFLGFGFVGLTARLDGGGYHYMELCTIGPDKNVAGWEWFCENFCEGPRWLPLGEINNG